LLLPAIESDSSEGFESVNSHRSRMDGEATTAVDPVTFQGRVFRVHCDRDAPPVCESTAAADRPLSNEVLLFSS
jgi:hypothetical protein